MSWDERRFMQNAEETVELRNEHYQISLPLKKSLGTSTKQHFSGYAARKLVEKETEERAEIVGRL